VSSPHKALDRDARQTTIAAYELGGGDFREIVIFGRYPEDGHGLCATVSQTARELDGRERFVNRVERTGK
jgi:hypothetical protein